LSRGTLDPETRAADCRGGSGSTIRMISRFNKNGRVRARAIAALGAALLLVSQIIGVAHFHESAASRDGIVSARAVADQGLCPICQLALHSPGSVSAAVTVAGGAAMVEVVFNAAPGSTESPAFSATRGRAPPISL
jgi:hypothetical protein